MNLTACNENKQKKKASSQILDPVTHRSLPYHHSCRCAQGADILARVQACWHRGTANKALQDVPAGNRKLSEYYGTQEAHIPVPISVHFPICALKANVVHCQVEFTIDLYLRALIHHVANV